MLSKRYVLYAAVLFSAPACKVQDDSRSADPTAKPKSEAASSDQEIVTQESRTASIVQGQLPANSLDRLGGFTDLDVIVQQVTGLKAAIDAMPANVKGPFFQNMALQAANALAEIPKLKQPFIDQASDAEVARFYLSLAGKDELQILITTYKQAEDALKTNGKNISEVPIQYRGFILSGRQVKDSVTKTQSILSVSPPAYGRKSVYTGLGNLKTLLGNFKTVLAALPPKVAGPYFKNLGPTSDGASAEAQGALDQMAGQTNDPSVRTDVLNRIQSGQLSIWVSTFNQAEKALKTSGKNISKVPVKYRGVILAGRQVTAQLAALKALNP